MPEAHRTDAQDRASRDKSAIDRAQRTRDFYRTVYYCDRGSTNDSQETLRSWTCLCAARVESLDIPPRGPRERAIETSSTTTRVARTRRALITESTGCMLRNHSWASKNQQPFNEF